MIDITILLGIILAAGVVRGYSGFGFSALVLLSGSLLVAPQALVPVLYLLEIVGGAAMLYAGGLGAVRWALLLPLMGGSVLAIPLGQWLLAGSDASLVMVIAGAAVALFCLLLWRGFALPHTPHRAATFAVGMTSGALNGLGSLGGLPIATYLLATRQSPEQLRGTLAMLVVIVDGYSFASASWFGLVDAQTWRLAALALPALGLGFWLGHRLFLRSDPARFRRVLLLLLATLALLHPLRHLGGPLLASAALCPAAPRAGLVGGAAGRCAPHGERADG